MTVYSKFILILSLFFLTGFSLHSQETTIVKSDVFIVEDGTKFHIHTVKPGETLYSLSKAYKVGIKEIAGYNKNALNGINVGQKIKIPYVEDTKIVKPTQHDGKSSYTHIVQQGETLYSISKKYHTTPELIKANNKGLTSILTVGQKLYIQTSQSRVDLPVGKQPEIKSVKSTNKVVIGGKTYLLHSVKKGETAYGIKNLYGIPIEVLYIENPKIEKGFNEGMTLKIPVEKEYKEKNFIYHSVKKGETLYFICKKYNVVLSDVIKDNPGVEDGLQTGTILRVAINEDNVEEAELNISSKYIYHEVKKGETFYYLMRKYNVSKRELKKSNRELKPNDLKIGAIVRVPTNSEKLYEYIPNDTLVFDTIKQYIISDTAIAICCDSLNMDTSRVLNIVLMLPFYLTANDTIDLSENIIRRHERIYSRSHSFIEFYEGVLIALEDLKKQKYSINLTVLDTEKDTNVVKKSLAKLNPKKVDLIIGPVYEENIEIVSNYAAKFGIPVVSPLSAKSECIDTRPNLIVINTPEEYRTEAMSLYLSQYHDNNFVFLYNAHIDEYDIIQDYKTIIRSADTATFNNVAFKELNYAETGVKALETALSPKNGNFIVIPSYDQAFVNDIVTKLYQFKKDFDITLCGMAMWEHYQNIELDYLFDLKLSFASSSYVNYNDKNVKTFIKKYRKEFLTDPSVFSFKGYDVMKYFATALRNYGENIQSCILTNRYTGLQSEFMFERKGPNAGIVNKGVFLISYTTEYKREELDFNLNQARERMIKQQLDEQKKTIVPQTNDIWGKHEALD